MTAPMPTHDHMNITAITSGKGGVGKTFVSANLAAVLAGRGKKVLVLDADLGLANLDVLELRAVEQQPLFFAAHHRQRGRLQLHEVAPLSLGSVKLQVGAADPDGRRGPHPLRREGPTDADADADLLPRRHGHGRVFNTAPDALGHRLAEGAGAVGQDDGEFLAAHAGHQVHGAHAVGQRVGHGLDDLVATRGPSCR